MNNKLSLSTLIESPKRKRKVIIINEDQGKRLLKHIINEKSKDQINKENKNSKG